MTNKVSLQHVSFSSTPEVRCTCDRCGQGIKNVWSVSFTNNVTYNYGIDCFEKLSKHSNLSEIGKKNFKKLLKSLKKCEENVAKWETMTYEQYEEMYWANIKDEERQFFDGPLKGEYENPNNLSWEEFKARKLDCAIERLNNEKKELDKFNKVWFIVEE
jgi:hypothetical protein